MTLYEALVRGRVSGCNLALSYLSDATDKNGNLDVAEFRTLVKNKAASLLALPVERVKILKRLSYSTLDLRPLDGTKHRGPFVATLYLDPREGSYVTFGRSVHHTLMLGKKS